MLTQSECWHEILSRHSCGLTHVWQISIPFINLTIIMWPRRQVLSSILTRGGHLCKLEHYWSICNPFDWGYVVQIFVARNTGPYHPGLSVYPVCGVYPVTSWCDGCWQDDTLWHWQVPSSVTLSHTQIARGRGETEHLVNITCEDLNLKIIHIRTHDPFHEGLACLLWYWGYCFGFEVNLDNPWEKEEEENIILPLAWRRSIMWCRLVSRWQRDTMKWTFQTLWQISLRCWQGETRDWAWHMSTWTPPPCLMIPMLFQNFYKFHS